MNLISSMLLSVYPSTKGAEYIIALLFLAMFVGLILLFYKSGEDETSH